MGDAGTCRVGGRVLWPSGEPRGDPGMRDGRGECAMDTADIVAVDRNLTVPRRGERRGRLSPGRAISHRK